MTKEAVIALREIAEKKVSVKDLENSAINKLRKYPEEEQKARFTRRNRRRRF